MFIATRFVEGMTLQKLVKEAPLPWDRVARIAIGILEALEVSHSRTEHRAPILHRDIKPANVVLGPNDEVTVLDFGVAKLASATRNEVSQVVGTLNYMAPEQLEPGVPIGPTVDLDRPLSRYPRDLPFDRAIGVVDHEVLEVLGEQHDPRQRRRRLERCGP